MTGGVGFVFIDVRAAGGARRLDVEEKEVYIRLRVIVSEVRLLFAVDDRVCRIGGDRAGVVFDLLLLCFMIL